MAGIDWDGVDARAKAFAEKHQVSYTDALRAVSSRSNSGGTTPPPAPRQTGGGVAAPEVFGGARAGMRVGNYNETVNERVGRQFAEAAEYCKKHGGDVNATAMMIAEREARGGRPLRFGEPGYQQALEAETRFVLADNPRWTYTEALVEAARKLEESARLFTAPLPEPPIDYDKLDVDAKTFAAEKGISYSDALVAVSRRTAPSERGHHSFAEGVAATEESTEPEEVTLADVENGLRELAKNTAPAPSAKELVKVIKLGLKLQNKGRAPDDRHEINDQAVKGAMFLISDLATTKKIPLIEAIGQHFGLDFGALRAPQSGDAGPSL